MSENDKILKSELEEHSKIIYQFIDLCNSKGIHLNIFNFDYVPTIGIVCKYPNILLLLNPNLQLDKEDLLDFKILDKEYERKPFASGYFYAEKYMPIANPYFRRGYNHTNNFSPKFIEIYWKYEELQNHKYISLDLDRVRVNVDSSIYGERDIWYGAKFKHKIEDIEDGIVKLRPPSDLNEKHISSLFGDIYSLDIKWYTKDNIKVFQSEEFKTDTVKTKKNNKEYFPVKYIHAEYDQELGSFRHFDGAIHFYTKDEYYQRRDTDFNHNNKTKLQIKTLSQKLFKVNGSISKVKWIELTSHFLYGNHLIFEYFEGKLPESLIESMNMLKKST
jgi:hypothetical protein